MDLRLAILRVAGFKSFMEPATLNLDAPGLHFVRGQNEAEPRLGSNGSGKSSLFDALCWCLYGKTPAGLKNTDIKPWSWKTKTEVSVKILIDGVLRVVRRTANPNGFYIDDVAVAADGAEHLIGLNYDVFTNTVLMGQGQPLFFDLQPKAKMQLFVDVLNLDRWDTYSAKARAEVTTLNREQAETEGEKIGTEASLASSIKMFADAEARMNEWKDEVRARMAKLKSELATLTTKLAEIEPKLGAADLVYDGAATEWKAIDKTRTELRNTTAMAQKPVHKFNLARGLVQHTIATLEKNLAVDRPKNCPSCGQALTKASLATLEKHSEEARGLLLQAQEDLVLTESYLVKAEKKLAAAEKAEADFLASIAALEKRMDESGRIVRVLQPEVERLRSALTRLNQQLQDLENGTNPHREVVSTLLNQKIKLKTKADELSAELKKRSRLIERTKFWIDGFKEVRLYLIGEVLSELELTTNALLEEVGLIGWSVRYEVEKETKSGTTSRGLTVMITSPATTEPVRWESWSGGEGQRLRLVGALALSEVLLNHAGVRTNLEILDEPTQHLSREGVRELADYLAGRAQLLGRSTFYIDHNTIESGAFASTITVVKDSHGSRLA